MKKTVAVILAVIFLLISLPLASSAAEGTIAVNGEAFSGTLAEAIVAANGGTVSLTGTVYTFPIGKTDGTLVKDVTIEGVGDNQVKVMLSKNFTPGADDNLDILTIKGNNVTLRNLYLDAELKVDYPLNTFGCDNVTVEDVTVCRGKRGGVNVMTGGHVLFKNVTACNSLQAGFAFECCGDAANIRFENCVTYGNKYGSGILVCNGYGRTLNVDASGIVCRENSFSVHDRSAGVLGGGARAEIRYTAPANGADGNPVDTSRAIYYPFEKAYLCIRFGATEEEVKSASCYVDTTAYGFSTRVYFPDKDSAQKFLHEGESVVTLEQSIFEKIINWFRYLINTIKVLLGIG